LSLRFGHDAVLAETNFQIRYVVFVEAHVKLQNAAATAAAAASDVIICPQLQLL
jgi:hypothetical protein